MKTKENFRSDFKKVAGLGSAGSGSHHWWHQRLTAIFLVPLFIWFMYFITKLSGQSFAFVLSEFKKPCNITCLILFSKLLFYHACLGMQVVIEDYVSCLCTRNSLIIIVQYISFVTVVSLFVAFIYLLII